MSNAPSFDGARETLAGLLDDWVFGTVMSVKVPDTSTSYFHGVVKTPRGRAWFQQTKSARRPKTFGPITVPTTHEKPKVGDVLMGKLDTADKARLLNWHGDAKAMRELSNVCLNGTSKCEFQLLADMRTTHDDIWALCRLVMFGNVQVFADAYLDNKTMNLSKTPLKFVYETSTSLCDPGVWDAFVKIVPSAEPPIDEPVLWEPPVTNLEPVLWEPPVTNLEPVRHPYEAYASPPYNSTTPPDPVSPPYNPTTPPYNPESPPYNPTTPPKEIDIDAFAALIEQYCPPVQAYDPENPAYNS